MNLSHDAWVAVTQGIITLGGIAVAALGGRVYMERKTRESDAKVEEVRALAEPTGNGFAGKVLSALDRVERRQMTIDERTDRVDLVTQRAAERIEGLSERVRGLADDLAAHKAVHVAEQVPEPRHDPEVTPQPLPAKRAAAKRASRKDA